MTQRARDQAASVCGRRGELAASAASVRGRGEGGAMSGLHSEDGSPPGRHGAGQPESSSIVTQRFTPLLLIGLTSISSLEARMVARCGREATLRAAAARQQGPRTVHELSDHGEEHEAQRVFDKMLLWFCKIVLTMGS